MKPCYFHCAWFLGAGLVVGSAGGEVTYRVTDLGTLDGGGSEAFAINENGQVVGWASIPNHDHAFVWLPAPALGYSTAGMKDIDIDHPERDSYALGINLEGRITGYRDTAQSVYHAFLWEPFPSPPPEDRLEDIGSLGGPNYSSKGWGISDGGVIVGESSTSQSCSPPGSINLGFTWTAGVMTSLPAAGQTPPPGSVANDSSAAFAISPLGDTIGGSGFKCGDQQLYCGAARTDGVFWPPGTALAQPPGFGDGAGEVLGANDQSPAVVVGWGMQPFDSLPFCRERGLLWTLGSPVVDLHAGVEIQNPPPATQRTIAKAVNDYNNVVGKNLDTDGAVLWQFSAGTWTHVSLQSRIGDYSTCGWTLVDARDISNAECIVGWGYHNNGRRAFLLTPLGTCPWDTNDDGYVDTVDFLALLQQWGACQVGVICTGDNNGNCVVDTVDFLALLQHWGPCPSAAQGPQGAGPEGSQSGWGLTPEEAVVLMGFADLEAYQAWLADASEEEALASAEIMAALLLGY